MSDTDVILRPSPSAKEAAAAGWSRRVRRLGGFIQLGFATFLLVRGSLEMTPSVGIALAVSFAVAGIGAISYGIRTTADRGPRPTSAEGRRIEHDIRIAALLQITASIVAPVFVTAIDRPDWALPSIALTMGPLLLWLDHRVDVPRYRPVGWALIIGPVVLAATVSGASLAAATGISAGLLLLATALAGFHDLAADQEDARPRLRHTGNPAGSTGLGATFGAAVGLTIGLIAQGHDGIALGAAVGAGTGVALGLAIDASRLRRTATTELLSDA